MKRALLLYNTLSGRGRSERSADLSDLFRDHGYELLPQRIDFGADPFEGYGEIDLVVIAGGDGTVNFVINAMKRRALDIPIGIIPSGTANDFARAIGMSHNPAEAARQILTGEEHRIDCGTVNDRHFVNILSFGLFTTTSQHTPDRNKHRFGRLAYIAEGLKELRTMHAIPLEVEADDKPFSVEALMVLIFNGETAGGFRLARRSSVQDGKLDCLILERRSLVESALSMIRFLLRGNSKNVKQIQAEKLTLRSPVAEPTDVDGQRGADFPLEVRCLAGKLRVRCAAAEK